MSNRRANHRVHLTQYVLVAVFRSLLSLQVVFNGYRLSLFRSTHVTIIWPFANAAQLRR